MSLMSLFRSEKWRDHNGAFSNISEEPQLSQLQKCNCKYLMNNAMIWLMIKPQCIGCERSGGGGGGYAQSPLQHGFALHVHIL